MVKELPETNSMELQLSAFNWKELKKSEALRRAWMGRSTKVKSATIEYIDSIINNNKQKQDDLAEKYGCTGYSIRASMNELLDRDFIAYKKYSGKRVLVVNHVS